MTVMTRARAYVAWSLLAATSFITAIVLLSTAASDLEIGAVMVVLFVAAEGIRRTAPDDEIETEDR